jgi:signal transduction histidine kinase
VTDRIVDLEHRLLPSVATRARAGLIFMTVASALLVPADFFSGAPNAGVIASIQILRLGLFAALCRALRPDCEDRRAVALALASIALLATSAAVVGVLRDGYGSNVVVSAAMALAAAASVPWGPASQALASTMLGAGLLANIVAVDGGFAVFVRNPVPFAYLMSMVGSVYLAGVLSRQRDAAREALGEVRSANATLAGMASELECRVQERTAELAASNRELEEAWQELSGFTRSVSHDIRVPLRVINGLSGLALEECGERLDENGRDYLRRIADAAVQVGRVGDDLLTLARVSRAPMERRRVDVSEMADAIVRSMAREDPARILDARIDQGLVVTADPALLRIVLEQLLDNAWKFSRTVGAPTVRVVGARPADDACDADGQGGVGIAIIDNGVGFAPEFAHKLFGRFERIHDLPDVEGRGIGLAIVERIVTRHGGRVWAWGSPGAGATFGFTLP